MIFTKFALEKRMNMKHSFLIMLGIVLGFFGQAQTLFTVAGEPTTVDEFKTMYKKNSQGKLSYDRTSLQENLDLFVSYKLKLAEADAQKLADNPAVKKEIAAYEEQLIRSTFDKKIMQNLLDEAYMRSKEEVCVSHLLLNVKNNASPQDTLAVYQEAIRLRESILQGADFGAMVKRYSADVDSKFNNGELGCFTALQVSIYEIENAAYDLKKGEISIPVRTRLGYHLIKMDERRPSSGTVTAAHIFVRSNSTMNDEQREAAVAKIHQAYDKIKAGENFESVALEFSEDIDTKSKGGVLPAFSVGTYETDFENTIFNIKKEGNYTKPSKTSVGWHIFKLIEKAKHPEFAEMEADLRTQIIEDERYELARRNYSNSLKKDYNYKRNQEHLDSFLKEVAPGITIQGWQVPSSYPLSNVFFSLENKNFTAGQFVNYVKQKHKEDRFLSFSRYYNNFESEHLLAYHKTRMIESDPGLADLLKEYQDGIVLFNLMENEIWSKSKPSDDVLETFYNKNSEIYNTPDKVKVYVYTPADVKRAKKLRKALKKELSNSAIQALGVTIETIELEREEAKIGGVDLWRIGSTTSRTATTGGLEYLKSFGLAAGETNLFNDVKGKIMAQYQKTVEEDWIAKLKTQYPVQINESVFETLVK